MMLTLVRNETPATPPQAFPPEAVALLLDAGYRRILLRERRGMPGIERLPTLVAGQAGRTLVLAEFENVRRVLADMRGALGDDKAAPWGEDADVVVGNYERVGLYARFVEPDAFSLLILLPRQGQNERSARTVLDRFGENAAVVQTVTGEESDFGTAEAEIRRESDGRLRETLRIAPRAVAYAAAS